jgi:hypothetical protein
LWGRLTGSDDEPAPSPRAHLLDEVLGDPLRTVLWKRSLLGATVAQASVGAMQLEERIGRSRQI